LGDAHDLLQRSLTIREKALGQDHPDVAIALYNFALNYTWRTRGAAGERSLYLRALAIREKAFGAESAPVVDSLLRLAHYDENVALTEIDDRVGFMSTAAKSRERALQIQEKLYGSDSIELADNLIALTQLYLNEKVGAKSEAGAILDRTLTIAEKTFGGADFWRAAQIENLTASYRGAAPTEAA
jgi:tetratricopeptide (TPR) repeat protein